MKRLCDCKAEDYPDVPEGFVFNKRAKAERNLEIYRAVRQNAERETASFDGLGRYFGISCTRVIAIVNGMRRKIEGHNAKVLSD